jgi:hypothetical protein
MWFKIFKRLANSAILEPFFLRGMSSYSKREAPPRFCVRCISEVNCRASYADVSGGHFAFHY